MQLRNINYDSENNYYVGFNTSLKCFVLVIPDPDDENIKKYYKITSEEYSKFGSEEFDNFVDTVHFPENESRLIEYADESEEAYFPEETIKSKMQYTLSDFEEKEAQRKFATFLAILVVIVLLLLFLLAMFIMSYGSYFH